MRPRDLFKGRTGHLTASLLAGLLLLALAANAASRTSPRGLPKTFFGLNANTALLDGSVNLNAQLARMNGVGTGAIRFPIYWNSVQPHASRSSISFKRVDTEMRTFVSHGLRPLPVILQAPSWARVDPSRMWSPPANPRAYGRFVGALVRRYGSRGTFWRAHRGRRLAPRWWQIWNEPAGGVTADGQSIFWDGPEPYEPRYIAMLRAARSASRAADPKSRIMLGGLFGTSWKALTGLYQHGARGLFDAVAVHPYANTPAHVLTILSYVRHVMVSHGDRRLPMIVTETSWTSSANKIKGQVASGIITTAARQASNLSQEYPLLARHRHALNLQGIYWYTWIGREPSQDPFDYSGLLSLSPRGAIHTKPAYQAYRTALRRLER